MAAVRRKRPAFGLWIKDRHHKWMGEWMDGWWMDNGWWMDGWMVDGWMEGRKEKEWEKVENG